MMLTYQTRLLLDEKKMEILLEYAYLFNKVERCLYAETVKGKASSSCKSSFLKQYGITARQFNACRVSLEGKIAACQSCQEQNAISLQQKIETLDKKIVSLGKKKDKQFSLHQKKRRKNLLITRLEAIKSDIKEKRVHLCFGGKKLFRKQFYLEENGYSSHEEWKQVWEDKRNSEFFVLGSKDEVAGNQTCTAKVQANGKLSLRLRLPNALAEKHGKYIEMNDIFCVYGHEAIVASLNNPTGQALSYRFKKDKKGWTVFISTELKKVDQVSIEDRGVIGIDLNTDHIAYVETDRFGNPIKKEIYQWNSYGKTKNQLKAITGDLCKKIVDKAKQAKKPIVIEKLDFKQKKSELGETKGSKFSRCLSSFAYGLFFNNVSARAYKNGIKLHQVNPAFTSIMGRVNYATRYGLSVHLAAALCIARRYQKFSEAPISSPGKIPDGKGCHVAFVLPERNRTKHLWHYWRLVKKKILTVLAAHFRALKKRSSSRIKPAC